MSLTNPRDTESWFSVLQTAELSQSALMSIAPGEASGPKENEHPASEQVLYLIEGELCAEIGERSFMMRAGDSTIVRREVAHRFVNRGSKPALTLNVYTPPAY